VIGIPEEDVDSAVRGDRTSDEWQNDAGKGDVEIKENETIEIVDSDERICEKVIAVQVEGGEEGIRVTEGDAVHVKQGETVTIVDEDEDSCGNASDEQIEDGEGDDVHDYEKGGAEPGGYDVDDEKTDGQMEDDGESHGVDVSNRGRADAGGSEDDDESCENPSEAHYDDAGDGDSISNRTKCGEVDKDSASKTTELTDGEQCVEKEREVFFVGRNFLGLRNLSQPNRFMKTVTFVNYGKET